MAQPDDNIVGKLPEALREIYLELRRRVRAFGPNVTTYATRTNLVFRAGKNFAEITPKKACLLFCVRPEGYNIAEGSSGVVNGVKINRVPDKFGWACNHQFEVDASSVLDNVEKLLKQSYVAVPGWSTPPENDKPEHNDRPAKWRRFQPIVAWISRQAKEHWERIAIPVIVAVLTALLLAWLGLK